jgi:peptidoglycan hydrolase-like protein with peptidoglycan-binding domain
MITLKLGDHGDAVQILQTLLNSYVVSAHNLRESGDFGPSTPDAVVKFQKAKGLEANGVVKFRTSSFDEHP